MFYYRLIKLDNQKVTDNPAVNLLAANDRCRVYHDPKSLDAVIESAYELKDLQLTYELDKKSYLQLKSGLDRWTDWKEDRLKRVLVTMTRVSESCHRCDCEIVEKYVKTARRVEWSPDGSQILLVVEYPRELLKSPHTRQVDPNEWESIATKWNDYRLQNQMEPV